MIALSELLGAEVRSERDGALGKVQDVRACLAADGSWQVDRLLLRESGLAARLGLRMGRGADDEDSVSWKDVRSFADGVVVVP